MTANEEQAEREHRERMISALGSLILQLEVIRMNLQKKIDASTDAHTKEVDINES